MKLNPSDLIKLLKNHVVYIQTHNFPDPDAISSAYGLQQFLKVNGIVSTICYDGKIEKLNTKRMIELFQVDIYSIDQIGTMSEQDYIITVDAQKYNANVTDFPGDEVACIDHHPTFIQCQYQYKDIQMTGACASIIASYFERTNTPMDSNTATILSYGIKMDTLEFTRGVTNLDVDMFDYLYKQVDMSKIKAMYTNVMEFDDLRAYGAAIESISVYEKIGFASIPFDCPDALIATISDFILSLDVVEIAIVYATREDGLKISVRSEVSRVNAGLLTQNALKGIGDGGGHPFMAGGFITIANVKQLGTHVDYALKKRFLNELEQEFK